MRLSNLKPWLIVLGLLLGFVATTLPANAQVMKTSTHKHLQGGRFQVHCNAAVVHLNGTQVPTITCPKPASAGSVGGGKMSASLPNIGADDNCNQAGELRIWWDESYSGWEICFTGTGFTNMTDYCAWGWLYGEYGCWNWNDSATSYRAECTDGHFYTDTNGNGSYDYFSLNSSNYLFGTGNMSNVPNDSLSSIQIAYSASSC